MGVPITHHRYARNLVGAVKIGMSVDVYGGKVPEDIAAASEARCESIRH